MIVALQVGFPVGVSLIKPPVWFEILFPPKVDVAQGTVKKRPKDSCQVVVDLSFNIPSKMQPIKSESSLFLESPWEHVPLFDAYMLGLLGVLARHM